MNYFTDAETTVTDTGLPNIPDAVQQVNIEHTRQQMNRVRVVIGRPMNVNSWFRSSVVNRAVGGSKTSAHLSGYAVDCWVHGLTNEQICDMIDAAGIQYDQLIDEFNGSRYWVHISFDPRMRGQRLIARKVNGKMTYRKV
jgi:hypothetical protein